MLLRERKDVSLGFFFVFFIVCAWIQILVLEEDGSVYGAGSGESFCDVMRCDATDEECWGRCRVKCLRLSRRRQERSALIWWGGSLACASVVMVNVQSFWMNSSIRLQLIRGRIPAHGGIPPPSRRVLVSGAWGVLLVLISANGGKLYLESVKNVLPIDAKEAKVLLSSQPAQWESVYSS